MSDNRPDMASTIYVQFVSAVQLSARNRKEVKEWAGEGAWFCDSSGDDELYADTVDGGMTACEGDWIVRDRHQNLRVMSDEKFRETYQESPQ